MSGGGDLMDNVASSYKQVLDMDEDALMRECQAALTSFDKLEGEYKSKSSLGINDQSAFVEKLQERHMTLRRFIEKLKVLESLRTTLISHLKEALNEQELKVKQIGSMLQEAQSGYKRIDELCQELGIDVERHQSSEPLAQEENGDEHNATTNVLTNLAAGAASATSPSPAPPEANPPAPPGTNRIWIGAKRYLTPADHSNGLRTKYIIAEDRDPDCVIRRINEAMSESNHRDREYYFKLPGMSRVQFDNALMQFCLPKRDGYRIWTTTDGSTRTKAIRLGTLLMDILDALKKNTHTRQKTLYYLNHEVYGNDYDGVFCPLLDEVCMILECLKLSLNVSNYVRGSIIGDVILYIGERVVLNPSLGLSYIHYPSHYVDNIKATTEIKFVLVVEKDTVVDMLVGLQFHKKHKCVVITGRGYPDLVTRAVVYKLKQYLHVPVYGLFDLDRDGLQIMFTYKYGSRSTAYQNWGLTVDDLIWIGVCPEDFDDEDKDPIVLHEVLKEKDCAIILKLVKSMPLMELEPENLNIIMVMLEQKILLLDGSQIINQSTGNHLIIFP